MLTLRKQARSGVCGLVHRAIPYPTLLFSACDGLINLSVAHKRRAQNEAEKMVLDGDVLAVEWETQEIFLLVFRSYAREATPWTLYALYDGWNATLLAFQAAQRTGRFRLPRDLGQAVLWMEALKECGRLEKEMLRFRSAAQKEKQMARKVAWNLELKRAETEHAAALARLSA